MLGATRKKKFLSMGKVWPAASLHSECVCVCRRREVQAAALVCRAGVSAEAERRKRREENSS